MTPAGFPHSDISGSKVACTSPKLIAAYHVLHRLLTPRHPPSALNSLIEIPWCSFSTATPAVVQTDLRLQRFDITMQLSKIENSLQRTGKNLVHKPPRWVVEITGLEPVTSAVQRRRSPN